jgi:hypothetical protein
MTAAGPVPDSAIARAYPPATRGLIVVWGLLAHSPFGGMTWQVLQHLAGLRALGFDVWYVEDSDRYLLDIPGNGYSREYHANVGFMERHLELLGLGDRWVFRPPCQNDVAVGARDLDGLRRLYRDADAVLNLCGAQELLPAHDDIRCLVYLETDPVANQVAVASGDAEKIAELSRYQHLFSYGTNFGGSDCKVPVDGFRWNTTVPPVVTAWWATEGPPPEGSALTTIVNWTKGGQDVVWDGAVWRWTKERSFARYVDVARHTRIDMEVAARGLDETVRDQLIEGGWRVRRSRGLDDPSKYRAYIRGSVGEFSVAKEQYVLPRSGWFSDRTVCYLAAGRPAIVEDTGFRVAADTHGLHTFHGVDDALDAIEIVADDYPRQSAGASELAHELFEADRVLGDVMREVGLL